MKKLEKNAMDQVSGGYRLCHNVGNGMSHCISRSSGVSCDGYYTHGGSTVSLNCWR
jgi:hypothetical protein